MIFLDSTVLVDYFNGRSNWQVEALESFLGKELIVIGDYVLTEVLQGFRNDKDFRKAKAVLELFPCFDICGKDIAIKRILKKKKNSKKEIENIIRSQMPLKKKLKYADFVINNNKSLKDTEEQVKKIIQNI